MNRDRLKERFALTREQQRAALVTFVTAGDPNLETSQAILDGLPAAGADIIELGMPFSDPMADGPAIPAGQPAGTEQWHDLGEHTGHGGAFPSAG